MQSLSLMKQKAASSLVWVLVARRVPVMRPGRCGQFGVLVLRRVPVIRPGRCGQFGVLELRRVPVIRPGRCGQFDVLELRRVPVIRPGRCGKFGVLEVPRQPIETGRLHTQRLVLWNEINNPLQILHKKLTKINHLIAMIHATQHPILFSS